MTFYVHAGRSLACLLILMAATIHTTAQTTPFGPHLWDKPVDPAIFEKRINEQLDLAQKSVDQLLAVEGARTIENTLAPYDNAIKALDTAGYQSYAMQIVNPDAAIRDRAQAMVQKVSAVATARAPWSAFLLIFAAMMVQSCYTSISAVVKAELFPTAIRTLGVAVPYALANAAFGGTAEYAALWFKSIGFERGFYLYASALAAVSFGVALTMKETRTHSRILED